MIKSMTGFGRSEYLDEKRNVTVEIKSVNHRYFDITVKMPRRYAFLEEKIKQKVKETLNRGKIEVSILVEDILENDTLIKLNEPLCYQYYDVLNRISEKFDVSGSVDLRTLALMPDVIKASTDVENEEEVALSILKPVEVASKNLENMRSIEGEKLKIDLLKKGEGIKEILDKIESRSSGVVKDYTFKLKDRIKELIGDSIEIPEDRILVEAAIFADKCAIDEEITRLNSHLVQLKNILSSSEETVGKKLDFLVQEMNREANTIGSKANDLEITNMMLDIKAEIEKIREQVQNIE